MHQKRTQPHLKQLKQHHITSKKKDNNKPFRHILTNFPDRNTQIVRTTKHIHKKHRITRERSRKEAVNNCFLERCLAISETLGLTTADGGSLPSNNTNEKNIIAI